MPKETIDNEQIDLLYEKACLLLEKDCFNEAIDVADKALSLIPIPHIAYEEALLIYIVKGDSYYYLDESLKALEFFYKANNCLNGEFHPFINMRIGQLYFEINIVERSMEYLVKAYEVAGKEVFENEDPIFLEILEDALQQGELILEEELAITIDNIVLQSSTQWRQGEYSDALKLLEQAWSLLPEDKVEYLESYVIACGFIENAISLKDKKTVKKWLFILLNSCPNIDFMGEREFIAAKAFFEIEDYDNSYKFFSIAQKEKKNFSFDILDEKYEKFYNSKTVKMSDLS